MQGSIQASQNTHELFSAAVGNSTLSTAFSATELSQSLQMIARTMKVRDELGVTRQTFFCAPRRLGPPRRAVEQSNQYARRGEQGHE